MIVIMVVIFTDFIVLILSLFLMTNISFSPLLNYVYLLTPYIFDISIYIITNGFNKLLKELYHRFLTNTIPSRFPMKNSPYFLMCPDYTKEIKDAPHSHYLKW